MIATKTNEPVSRCEPKLRRRDWVVLPMVGVLTVIMLAVSVELIAMWMFPQLGTGAAAEECMVFNDPSTGARGIPHCRVWEKMAESELTQYRFNSSGYRADEDFGPKKPDTYRIVMIGTSFATGMRMPIEKTFAAMLPLELSRRTGRKVELYNEALPYRLPDTIARHFDEVVKVQPDLILWILNDTDIKSQSEVKLMPNPDGKSSFAVRAWHRIQASYAAGSMMDSVRFAFRHTRTATMLNHFLYSSQSQFVKASLISGEYLAEPSLERKKRLKEFDGSAASIEAQAADAGIPLVAVLMPDHAETAMILMDELPPGIDPNRLDQDVRTIVTSHGATYIDLFPEVREQPDLQHGFFPSEGHPNAVGHAIFTGLLARGLTGGVVPALTSNAHSQNGQRHRE